jgi:hypothetical protein
MRLPRTWFVLDICRRQYYVIGNCDISLINKCLSGIERRMGTELELRMEVDGRYVYVR